MSVKYRVFFLVIPILCVPSGCNQKLPESVAEPAGERNKGAATGSTAPSQNNALPAGKTSGSTASDSTFELAAHTSDSYAVGKKASFTIILKPRGEYHINQPFPTSVTTRVPKAIALEKPQLLKADAKRFSEQQVQFEVGFTASESGEYQLNALVNFAVCTPKTCIPLRKNLTVLLKVN